MTNEERRAWLAQLKVGDEAAVFSDQDYNHPDLVTVEAVTSDKIITTGLFEVFSRRTGETNHHDELGPVSAHVLECADREKLWNAIAEKLPITTVRAMLKLLSEAEQQGKEKG